MSKPEERFRALIVEDDMASRRVLQSIIAKYGDYDSAVNGKEAVDAFMLGLKDNLPYDIMFLDIMMPEMNGHEVLKFIRDYEKDMEIASKDELKIVMTTALDNPQEVFKAYYKGGCTDYLVKPLRRDAVATLLQKYGLTEK